MQTVFMYYLMAFENALQFSKALNSGDTIVLNALNRGLSVDKIAQITGLNKVNVKNTISALKDKFNATTKQQLIDQARGQGIIGKPSSWAKGATLPPHNPFMGPAGTSSMHANSASSDATLNPGPGTSGNYNVISNIGGNVGGDLDNSFPYALPTILMPKSGALVCVGVGNGLSAGDTGGPQVPAVLVISPQTLNILASTTGSDGEPPQLTQPQSGHLAGGIYSYIDNNDDLVLVDAQGYMNWYNIDYNAATDTASLTLIKQVNIEQPTVATINPDYEGRIWYATEGGIAGMNNVSTTTAPVIGFYDPKSGHTHTFNLNPGELVANSISSSPAGVAVASTQALYLFRYNEKKGVIKKVWEYQYGNSGDRKPGQLSPGTGATPAFFGPKTGYEYVAITDNSVVNGTTPAENFCIVDTKTGELVGKMPFLGPNNSGTENAPIAVGKSVFSPSTYQYWYPPSAEYPSNSVPDATYNFVGGAQRVDLTGKRKNQNLQSAWTSNAVSAALPRLSIPDEQIYTLTASYNNAGLFSGEGVQYNFGAIDALTGTVNQFELPGMTDSWDGTSPAVATISNYNTNPLQMTGVISPDGVFYQGLASGIIAVGGPAPRYGVGITTDGYTFTDNVSFDGEGYTYAAEAINALVGNKLDWNGVDFTGINPNSLDFTWANGQTIQVNGQGGNVLNLAGAGIGDGAIDATLTVNFTDGTSSAWHQGFSNWCEPSYQLGEAIISNQDYRYKQSSSAGAPPSIDNTSNYIYGYSYPVPDGKTVASVTLPFQQDLRLLGIQMSASSQVANPINTMGIGTAPYQTPNGQGPDSKGQYYSSAEINQAMVYANGNTNSKSDPITLAWSGAQFDISGIPLGGGDSANITQCAGQTIDMPSGDFNYLYLIGAAAGANNGDAQTDTLIMNGQWNGSSLTSGISVQQTFSDWNNGGNPPAPGSVANETVFSWTGQLNQDGNQNGSSGNNAAFIYGYAIKLPDGNFQSLQLPNNSHINILGVALI